VGRGEHRGMVGNQREGVVGQGKGVAGNNGRVSLTLDNSVEAKSEGMAIAESKGSSSSNNRVVDDREDGRVVDERGGGSEDLGVTSQHSSVSLHDAVGSHQGEPVAVAETIGSVGSQEGSGHWDHRADRRVVDEGSGRGEHLGVTIQDSSVSIALAVEEVTTIATVAEEAVMAVSYR